MNMNAKTWGAVVTVAAGTMALVAALSPVFDRYAAGLIGIALGTPLVGWLLIEGIRRLARENLAIWASLFWKEWREHRWKLAALTAILLSTYLICLFTAGREGPLANAFIVLTFCTPLSTLFIAMGIAAKERATGSIGFLRALPGSPRRAAVAKLVVGYAAAIAPALLTLAVAVCFSVIAPWLGWRGDQMPFDRLAPFGIGVPLLGIALMALLASASLLIWSAVLGMNRSTELIAGVVPLIAVVAVWAVTGVAIQATQPAWVQGDPASETAWLTHRFVRLTIAPALPGGIAAYASDGAHRPYSPALRLTALTVYVATHSLLIGRWITAYGKNPAPAKRRVIKTDSHSGIVWLGPPSPSPLRAILWKQTRECLPIIGGVIALAAGFMTCMMLIEDGAPDFRLRAWAVLWMTAMSGFLAALLVGVAGFQDDLNAGTSAFWRSRPIDPSRWFWIKYASGFAVLAIVFGGVYALSWLLDAHESAQNSGYALQAVLAFWSVYSAAVCVACLVRNAVYAGILSFAMAGLSTGLAFARWGDHYLPTAVQAFILIVVSLALTLLAWQAMRRDWALRLA